MVVSRRSRPIVRKATRAQRVDPTRTADHTRVHTTAERNRLGTWIGLGNLENVRTACSVVSCCVIIRSSVHVSKQVRFCRLQWSVMTVVSCR